MENPGRHGRNDRRPDIVLFVNGLPLAVFELKNPYTEEPTVQGAWNQIQHYRNDIPLLFDYNALLSARVDGFKVLDALGASLNMGGASYAEIAQSNASVGQVLMEDIHFDAVSGQLQLTHGRSAAHAWVILGQPSNPVRNFGGRAGSAAAAAPTASTAGGVPPTADSMPRLTWLGLAPAVMTLRPSA